MQEKLKILLIDDSEPERLVVQDALKLANIPMTLTQAHDYHSAIATLQQQSFDCIFLGNLLPNSDLFKLIGALNNVHLTAPLIAITESGDEQTAIKLLEAGALDYIPKNQISPDLIKRTLRNSLRLHQAQVEAQATQKLLQESQERYRLILEGSKDGIWDWDILANQIYCNERFYQIVGLPTSRQQTYEQLLKLVHPKDIECFKNKLKAHLESQTEFNVELRLINASGEYRYCIAHGKAQRDEQGQPFRMAGLITDITESKRAEEQDRFLADASIVLAASLDCQKILSSLARLAVPYMADLCLVDIVEADGHLRRMATAYSNSTTEELSLQLLAQRQPNSNAVHPITEVLHTGRSKLWPSREQPLGGEFIEQLPENEQISYMIVPVILRGQTFGTISFISTQVRRCYGLADLALAEELARRAALAVENAKAHREAQEASENLRQAIMILGEQQQQLRILQQLTNLLNQRLTDLPGLLRVMVGSVCDAIADAQFCFITMHNPQAERLLLTVTAGQGAEKLRLEDAFAPEHGWLAQVFWTGESQLIQRDYQVMGEDLAACSPNSLPEFPAAIYAVAIESAQARRLGVLVIGNWEDPYAFGEEDRHLLEAVAEQAAIAIENARMIKALEERENRLEQQNEILGQQNQELERHRQQIQLQNLQLIEAARLKSQFLATMSHELRTPMNAVIGFSQVLLRQRHHQLTSQQVDMVERILNNAKHLLMLINDILDLSKIESGGLELRLEKFNVVQLITNTIEQFMPLAEQKKLELKLEITLTNPYIVNDSERLRQVLVNLFSNALKFTQSGGVNVSIWEESPEQLVLAVSDTGIGIPDQELQHIFEQFRQLDQSLNRKYDGTGLGLALTESLVELMQGKISVQSRFGQGSTFKIEFPRRLAMSNYRLT